MSYPQCFCPVRNRNELWFPMKCVIFLSLLLVDIIQLREYKVWVFKSNYFWVKLKLFDRKRCGQDTLGL